jgi:hypothetical protein
MMADASLVALLYCGRFHTTRFQVMKLGGRSSAPKQVSAPEQCPALNRFRDSYRSASGSEAVIWKESHCGSEQGDMTTKLDVLERMLFVVFVVATNAFVVINAGWAFLMMFWNSIFASIVPIISLVTLVSFLTFALLEDHLRSRRYGTDGFRS